MLSDSGGCSDAGRNDSFLEKWEEKPGGGTEKERGEEKECHGADGRIVSARK